MIHIPVLTKEVLEYLDPKPNENVVDGTVGQAGHTLLLLEKIQPEGRVLGIDLDLGQIENAKVQTEKYHERVVLVHDSYANVKEIVKEYSFGPVNGILLDLGYSSWQLADSGKGFSFQKDEALDMRFAGGQLTAEKIVNEYSQDQLQTIIENYGEEKFAKQIAKKIVEARKIKKIETTFELMNVLVAAVRGKRYAIPMFAKGEHRGLSIWEKAQIGARTFQALRIAVNDELASIEKVLPDAIELLAPGGRLVVISFHSLEDRIVKNVFREKEKEGVIEIVTKKPVEASTEEIAQNPRSRSAKLRAIIKI